MGRRTSGKVNSDGNASTLGAINGLLESMLSYIDSKYNDFRD